MRSHSRSCLLLGVLVFAAACATTTPAPATSPSGPGPATEAKQEAAVDLRSLEEELVARHGEGQRERISRGLRQLKAQWRPEDGDLAGFAREQFMGDARLLDATRDRLELVFEQMDGHALEIGRAVKWATEVDVGPMLPVDPIVATYDPYAHFNEDLFKTRIAFVVLLNWPLTSLEERTQHAETWSRSQWADARLAQRFMRRVPGEVQQEIAKAAADADLYIAQYNVWMHHVLDPDGRRLFPKGKRLISHWNLRDELKAAYADPKDGLKKQQVIAQVMERIVTQTIPAAVIDNPRVDWNPFTNTVAVAPSTTVEEGAPDKPAVTDGTPEPGTRYARLLSQFHAARKADPYSPSAPTQIKRVFEVNREMPEARVEALFKEILTSPLVAQVAKEAEKKLGRPLQPQDLWFDGFKARASIPEAELDALTKKRYPNADAFAKDMPRILRDLGFSEERARFLAERIRVDPSRGAGHAMPASRRGDFPRLRTRVEKDGMDYKGYNIAVHELGHNVEQVFSLYSVDHTLLAGVPNNAFTEALAFVFQQRDLELLGREAADAEAKRQQTLADFWQAWEMAGVALVDLEVWRWMYQNPEATPGELRDATVRIAQDFWNRYYAPVLGGKDSALLAIYSHMIAYPLYLADYPIGRMIAFQIEEHFEGAKDKPFGAEFERMASFGLVTPDAWMKHATGAPVSAGPLLRATEKALTPAVSKQR